MKTIGRWQTEEILDRGGQGVTYLVHRPGETDKFVLKKLKNQNRIERFKVEIEALRRLNHPNIIKVIDYELPSAEKAKNCYYVSGANVPASAPRQRQRPDSATTQYKRQELRGTKEQQPRSKKRETSITGRQKSVRM